MKKTNYIIFNILAVLGYFYGVLLIASILGIPLGIYSIISAHRYSSYSEMNEIELAIHKRYITNWIIFGCILFFPMGLIGLIVLSKINNNITVTNAEQPDSSEQQPKQTVEVEINTPKTDTEKQEKLEKLKRFKENGLISEEEFEQAKTELEEK